MVNGNSSPTRCNNCEHLETQLQATYNEINSLKLISNILSDECKSLNRASDIDPNANIQWSTIRPNRPLGSLNTPQPTPVHSSHGASNHNQYTVSASNLVHTSHGAYNRNLYNVSTSNHFEVLSNHMDPQQHRDTQLSLNSEESQKTTPRAYNKHHQKTHRIKPSTAIGRKGHTPHQGCHPKLQVMGTKNEEIFSIPTRVNGVTNENYISETTQETSYVPMDTVTQTINSLHETIKKLNKSECPSTKKHRILTIGDSHVRGLASSLNSLLNSDCDLLSIVKLGSKSNELKETAQRNN